MAVPSSGEISWFKLSQEKKINDYNSASGAGAIPVISMVDLVNGGNTTGFSQANLPVTNTNSPSRPNTSAPHAASEWYNYDHDAQPPKYLEVKTYELASFTTGRGTSDSQLSGASHSLSAFNKYQHSWIKVKMLDDTYDQLRFTYNKSNEFEVWTNASDDGVAPTSPMKAGYDFHGNAEGTGTYYVNGQAGQVVYIHMYYNGKTPYEFTFGSMYCQPRQ